MGIGSGEAAQMRESAIESDGRDIVAIRVGGKQPRVVKVKADAVEVGSGTFVVDPLEGKLKAAQTDVEIVGKVGGRERFGGMGAPVSLGPPDSVVFDGLRLAPAEGVVGLRQGIGQTIAEERCERVEGGATKRVIPARQGRQHLTLETGQPGCSRSGQGGEVARAGGLRPDAVGQFGEILHRDHQDIAEESPARQRMGAGLAMLRRHQGGSSCWVPTTRRVRAPT
jgi:hypothetical protein